MKKINQNIENTNINNSVVLQIAGNAIIDDDLLRLLTVKKNTKLLENLIIEKLDSCSKFVLKKQVDDLRKVVQTFLTYGLEDINSELQKQIRYYQFLVAVLEKNSTEMKNVNDLLETEYLSDAEYIMQVQDKDEDVQWDKYVTIRQESKVVILDILFSKCKFDIITNLWKLSKMNNADVDDVLLYYTGISLFNLQNYTDAFKCLKQIQNKNIRDNMVIITLLTETQIALEQYQQYANNKDQLIELYTSIENEEKSSPGNIVGCEELISEIKLAICQCVMPEKFYDVYLKMDSSLQDKEYIQIRLAQFYEIKSDFESAINVYEKLDAIKNDSNIAYRYLLCNLYLKRYDTVIEFYDNLMPDLKKSPIVSVWLGAIKQLNNGEYKEKLRGCIEQYKDSLIDMYYLSLSIEEEKEIFDTYFFDLFTANFSLILEFDFSIIINIVREFLIYEHISNAVELLKKIRNIGCIDSGIFEDLFYLIHCDRRDKVECGIEKVVDLKKNKYIDEKIEFCEWFINNKLRTDLFLKEKIKCLSVLGRKNEMLLCLKELFEIKEEPETAINIIVLLLENGNMNDDEYEKYINELEKDDTPRSCLAIASVYNRLGKVEVAEFYGYKALFLLNEAVDYEVLKGYMALRHKMLPAQEKNVVSYDSVKGNTVVTLQYDKDIKYVCLDEEDELYPQLKDNKCLNAKHYGKRDLIYLRLMNKKINDKIRFDEKEYFIKEIVSRETFSFRYVMEMCIKEPEKTSAYAIQIEEGATSDEILKQLQTSLEAVIGKKESSDEVLSGYHFVNNDLGFPIEILARGDYERYIDAVNFLLFSKDQALYAGEVNSVCFNKKSIILSFSSLLLLRILNLQKLLDPYIEQIMIPTSLTEFIANLLKKITDNRAISPGKLVDLENGKMAMIPPNDEIVEQLADIYDLCSLFKQIDIPYEERIDFKLDGELSADMLFSNLKINYSQLDCMILAKKQEDGILICDDLFLRRIASLAQINNANNMSFLLKLEDKNEFTQICLDLSKTNYIYIPMFVNNTDVSVELWNNLLNGEKKKKYYGSIINRRDGLV